MGPTYAIAVEGLDALEFIEEIPASIERSAVMAVNKVTRRGRTKIDRGIRAQVAFSASYLAPSAGRLVVAKLAKKGDLEGIVRGRRRATSLARFTNDKPLQPGQAPRKKGIKLKVKTQGGATYLANAFIIPLRSGTEDLGNLGLAVRSDTKPSGAYKPKLLGKNLWLLYGPSVSQIMYSDRNQGGVVNDVAPELAEELEAEWLRLMTTELR